MKQSLPGRGLLGWLGRQFGYVRKAIRSVPGDKTVYREQNVEEKKLPDDPSVTLRRTTIDEVVVRRKDDG